MPIADTIQGDDERMTSLPNLTIEPLTPDRFADVATLFEEGGDPRWCWCAYFRVRGVDFSNAAKARHRAVLETAVDDGVALGRAPGLVAYEGADAVGWISIGPREDYERLAHSRVLAPIDERPVWSIVCFVVARRARGRGVANALLDAGIGYARSHGATTIEAYPVEVPEGGRISSSDVYRGTLAMFERAGFKVVARRQWNASTPERPIVRLDLGRGPSSQSARVAG
jgi:GNAT superfamily N-acetyltransferase